MALVDASHNSVEASLHDYHGVCDFCQEQCDSETQDLNLVCCSYAKCRTPGVFHQCCVDEYLKKRKLGKNAKIGFPCPRGFSNKSPEYGEPCKGRVFRLHHVHARMENSKKRQKAKMPETFLPNPAKREKKEKKEQGSPDRASAKVDKAPASPATKQSQSFVKILAPAGKQPVKKQASPLVGSKPPAGLDKKQLDAIRKEVEAMRQARGASAKSSTNGPAKAKKPASKQDSLLAQLAQEEGYEKLSRAWGAVVASDVAPVEEPPDSDEEDGEWMTVVGRKKGKHSAATTSVGMSRKQAKKQAWHDKVAVLKATEATAPAAASPAPKAAPKPAAKAPAATAPAAVLNPWGKLKEEPQAPPPHRSSSPSVAAPSPPTQRQPSPSAPSGLQELRPWSENLETVLKEHKIRIATKQLLELGFPDWLSVTAVRACGTDVDRCCEWLQSGQAPADPVIDLSQDLARMSKWVTVGCLSQDVVEIALISCSGEVNAAEAVLRSNFDHFAEHATEDFATDPTPSAAPRAPTHNSWSDELFPLSWGDAVPEPKAPPPMKKEQAAFPPLAPPKRTVAPPPVTPAHSASTPFEVPKALLAAANDSFITDLSRYNELLGISDEESKEESDEESEEEEGDEDGGGEEAPLDPECLWKKYMERTAVASDRTDGLAPATPPATEARSSQAATHQLDVDNLLAAYGILPKTAVPAKRPYMPVQRFERPAPEEDQDMLVSQLMNQLLV